MSLTQTEVIEHDAANGVSIERETLTDYSQVFNTVFVDEDGQRVTFYCVDERAAYLTFGLLLSAVKASKGER